MNTTIDIHSHKEHLININIYEGKLHESVLVICSATGVKQTYYKKIAKYFQGYGITVITFDYEGIGNSLKKNIKHSETTLTDWGKNDLEAVLEYSEKKFPNYNLIILGHSIGGQLIGLAKKALLANKIILICSQSGYWGHWEGIGKLKMWLNWNFLFPFLINLFGYMPSKKISNMENLPKKVAIEWKEWCNSKNYLLDHLDSERLFFDRINCELISYSVDDDQYAPKKAVDWLISKYSNTIKTQIHIMPRDFNVKSIGHFGLFHEKFKDTFWHNLKNEVIK